MIVRSARAGGRIRGEHHGESVDGRCRGGRIGVRRAGVGGAGVGGGLCVSYSRIHRGSRRQRRGRILGRRWARAVGPDRSRNAACRPVERQRDLGRQRDVDGSDHPEGQRNLLRRVDDRRRHLHDCGQRNAGLLGRRWPGAGGPAVLAEWRRDRAVRAVRRHRADRRLEQQRHPRGAEHLRRLLRRPVHRRRHLHARRQRHRRPRRRVEHLCRVLPPEGRGVRQLRQRRHH